MKASLLAGLLALCCSCYARAQTDEKPSGWHGTVGAGPLFFPKYVGSEDFSVNPVPLAFVEYDDWFHIDLFRAGAYFWSSEDKKKGLSFAVEPRFGFHSSDGTRVSGMHTRRDSLLGGPTFDWEGEYGSLSIGYFTDLTGASHGGYLNALFNKPLVKNEKWDVTGTLDISRLNSKFDNYYFGVRTDEVTTNRPFYHSGATTNVTVWLTGQYNLTKQYALLFGANVTQLGGAAANSPIVERRQVPLLYIGLGWNL
jgi:outer membrane protein